MGIHGSAYDTPEKGTSRSENPALLPPPKKKKSPLDSGHVPVRGLGMGCAHYPLYRSAEALEASVNMYFAEKAAQEKPFTMAGLALSLGFRSVKTLKTYEERGDDYASIIEVARTRVEEWKNELLLEGGRATNGVIFDLKNNHGWSDKIEQKNTLEATGTLAELLSSLQGTVLRPALQPSYNEAIRAPTSNLADIEEGVYTDYTESFDGDVETLLGGNGGGYGSYLDDLEDLV